MECHFNDNYDYLSALKTGSDDNCDANKEMTVLDSDSDDCVIIEAIPTTNETKSCKKSDIKSSQVLNESKECKQRSELPKSPLLKKCGFESINERINGIKNDLKSESKTKSINECKTELNDKKIDIKPNTGLDIKPFGIKSEAFIKSEELIKSEPMDTKDLLELKKFGSKSSALQDRESPELKSDFDVDLDKCLLSAIERVKETKQKPNIDRIFKQFLKLTANSGQSVSIFGLKTLIDKAIEMNSIEERIGSKANDISYNIVRDSGHKRRVSSNSNSRVLYKCSNNSDNSSSKRIRLSAEEVNRETNDSSNNVCVTASDNTPNNDLMSAQIDFESLATDGYCDIEDIDVSSSHMFAEVDPRVFESNLEMTSNETTESLTSMSLNSTPIKSLNHKKEREEMIRKTNCVSNTSKDRTEDRNERLWRNDYQNWLSEDLPRYSPFIAQKGDRVVYLRDAHKIYMEYELKTLREMYPQYRCTPKEIINAIKSDDYIINATVIDVKFYQINYIKYSVIRLKSRSKDDFFEFTLVYRPNRGIGEFLILEQLYKNPLNEKWAPGAQFRAIWEKTWWIGVVEEKSAFNRQYPNSLFKCLKIKWNSGEVGRLSPWDLFEVDPKRMPKRRENGIRVIREDLLDINYRPESNEWPEVDCYEFCRWRCFESKRIYNGIKAIEKYVSKPIVSTFRDCKHPDIAYPMNLKLIKERLKNMFYRRKESIIFDINYFKTICKLFINKKNYKIAEQFVELLLRIADDCNCIKEEQYLNHINKYKHLTEDTAQIQTIGQSTPSSDHTNTSTSRPQKAVESIQKSSKTSNNEKTILPKKKVRKPSDSQTATQPTMKITKSKQWKVDSQKFIDDLFKNDKSIPYRQAVDPVVFPTYSTVIENPIDLSKIQSNLTNDIYINPIELRLDFRLMYNNAKVFTKDPKSKMRSINKELYNLSEDRLRTIIVDWERIYGYEVKQRAQKGVKVREPISRNQLWGYGAEQYY